MGVVRRFRREPTEISVELDGQEITVSVRRLSRARRMTLRVDHVKQAVCLSMPMGISLEHARNFVLRHSDWVSERVRRLPRPKPFRHRMILPLRGVEHEVAFVTSDRGRGRVVVETRKGNRPRLVVAGPAEHCPRRLRDWLIEEARRDLDRSAVKRLRKLGVRARKITVRDQVSRWGSCSSTGVLSFSWRLILAPPPILDYLVAHEVAHLVEMNHGKGFWALVRKLCPKYEAARHWLKIEGARLHAFGLDPTYKTRQAPARQRTYAG